MAGIDLLNLQPHQVSRDLRGYSVFFYGEPKSKQTALFIGNYKANIAENTERALWANPKGSCILKDITHATHSF